MSIQASMTQLTVFLNRLYEGLSGNSKLACGFCAETTPANEKSSGINFASLVSAQPLRTNELMRKEDLERYCATPGEAEWGC